MANIRLKELIEANVDPKLVARSKESGKLVYFKSPEAKAAAVKAGSHEEPKKDKKAQAKQAAQSADMFKGDYSKERGMDSSDDEFKGTYDLADVADDIKDDIDTSLAFGEELKGRLDKGEKGQYHQTSELGGIIEFENGDKYDVTASQDGEITVDKIPNEVQKQYQKYVDYAFNKMMTQQFGKDWRKQK